MPYEKTNWIDDVTPISATNLNKIEQELSDIPSKTIANTVSRVLATKSGLSFPARTGAGPYIYTPVTLTFPISTTVEEVEIQVDKAHIKLFKGINYAVMTGYNEGTPNIRAVNLGYGATFSAASDIVAPLVKTSGAMNTNIKLADAYKSGGFIYLKFFSIYSGEALGPYSDDFEYILRG